MPLTESEILAAAASCAERLNMPWDPATAVARPMLPFWPFPGRWRVVSRVRAELAETTIHVNAGTGDAVPRSVRHRREFGGDREGRS